MNKILFFGLIAAAFLGVYSAGMAQNDNTNSSDNEQLTITTINQIGNFAEGETVTLQGNLTQDLGNNMYIFTDDTGNINAIIEAGDWNGTTFNPDTLILVTGQIDKNGDITQLDVTEIQEAQ